jgi:peroxiredoxin/mono/diheme cytochrome c family protein
MRPFRRGIVLPLTLAFVAGLLPGGEAQAGKQASTDKLGKVIDRVTFQKADGKTVALRDFAKHKAVVAIFFSFDCPVSTNYSQPLAIMAEAYKGKGVAFIGIVPGADESAAKIAQLAREYKIPFAVYRDDKLAAVEAFQANITPQAFVLDRNLVLRYRGRIDNAWAARLKKNQQITSHDLRAALDEVLAGKAVSHPVTEAIGCSIQREKTAKTTGKFTYYRDVLPILQNNCQTCHRPGEVGPFSLMTYKQAVNWAGDIKEYTQARKMPPWKPVAGPAFHNERKLTTKEIATLAAWVDDDTPAGDPKDGPPPRKFAQGWQLGKPDLVLTVPDDFQVGPSGNDLFRCFVLPTNLPEDKYVTAVDIRPSNPRVVHHVLLYVDTTGQGRQLAEKEAKRQKKDSELDRGPGYSSAMGIGFLPRGGLGGWAPGQMPRYLPVGTGYPLPKGSDVIVQVHYHRDGRLEKDRTRVGLYFAKKPVKTPYKGMLLAGGGAGKGRLRFLFTVPAGDDNYKLTGSMWVEQDCTLYTVMPHMHMIGKKIRVTITPPKGKPQTLVAIDEWDYNWQETYILKKPITVKAGTRFDVEAYYDNSDKNPNNPFHPPKTVTFGMETTDEMCFVFLGATSDQPGRIRTRLAPEEDTRKQGESR